MTTLSNDIYLNEGENRLDVAMIPIPVVPFDPWQYDTDESCYIEIAETVRAGNDYSAGLITESQLQEVTTLWQNHTRNPACELPPPPPTDYLTMTKDELYSYLVNGSVANDWWSLSYEQRRQLGLKIIQWWSVEWFGYPYGRASGGANCAAPPDFIPWEHPELMTCMPCGMESESALRYCLFTDHTVSPTDIYWFRKFDDKWYCHNPGVSFSLPTAIALGDADWLNCLQIAEDVTKLNSWIFFQIWTADAYPGINAHLWPIISSSIQIYKVIGVRKKASGEFDPRGIADLGDIIAEIHY